MCACRHIGAPVFDMPPLEEFLSSSRSELAWGQKPIHSFFFLLVCSVLLLFLWMRFGVLRARYPTFAPSCCWNLIPTVFLISRRCGREIQQAGLRKEGREGKGEWPRQEISKNCARNSSPPRDMNQMNKNSGALCVFTLNPVQDCHEKG